MTNANNHQTIGFRLRRLREVHNYSQSQVARRINKSKQTVSSYENGRCEIPLTCLVAFCQLFSVDLNWLVLGDSNPDWM